MQDWYSSLLEGRLVAKASQWSVQYCSRSVSKGLKRGRSASERGVLTLSVASIPLYFQPSEDED